MSEQETDHEKIKARDSSNEKLRIIMSWIIVIILIGFGIFMLYKLATFHETEGEYWKTLVREQFPVLVGLPMAGLGALFLSIILRISVGPIEFEIGGLKFKGGAAQIVFWIICFLSISLSIGMLWQN